MLITKGDLFHQEAKVAASGLGDLFEHIAIVSEKDAATYRKLMARADVDPSRFLMVGNSLRSDIAPVLEIGAFAVHIPYHITWDLEHAQLPSDHPSDRHRELTDIRQLPTLLKELQPPRPVAAR